MLIHRVFGCILGVTCLFGIVANSIVLAALFRLKIWKASPFYFLAIANLTNDLLMVSLQGFYLTPALLAESLFFPAGKNSEWHHFLSYLYQTFWYTGVFLDILIALNRLFVIKRWLPLFVKPKVVLFIAILPFIIAHIQDILIHYIFYTTRPIINWETFGWDEYDRYSPYLSDYLYGLPLNVSVSIITALCYIVIMLHVSSEKYKKIAVCKAKSNEYRFALYYGLISLFYLVCYVNLPIFPWQAMWLYAVPTESVSLKSCANAAIFLIHQELRRWIGKKSSTIAAAQVFTKHSNQSQKPL